MNAAIVPVFQALANMITGSVTAVSSKYGKFSGQLIGNLITSLLQLGGDSFTSYIPDLTDPTYIIPFKRLLVESIFYLLKTEYFSQLGISDE